MAYQLQQIFKLKSTAAFVEATRLCEQLNEIARANGLTEARIMTQSFGPFNQIAINLDYPDLATYEREIKSRISLPEVRELLEKYDDLAPQADPGGSTMWEDVTSEEF
jgi:hypothetical protein